MKKSFFLSFLYIFGLFSFAESLSAQGVYRFLTLPASAHEAALGGYNASLYADGIDGAMSNPSLLTDETHNQLSLNFTNYFADVLAGNVIYGHNYRDHRFAAAFQFMDFGSFEGRDEFNHDMGTFTAKDFALNLMYARALSASKKWNIGANLKPIYSAYENYTSFALSVDVGLSYIDAAKGFCTGLTFANIGHQLTSYAEETEWLPFNAYWSISKKFTNAPIRISATIHHLNKWNLSYTNNVTTVNMDGTRKYETVNFWDMLSRHLIVGVDIIPMKYFYVSASYNRQRGAEMSIAGVRGINGFSFGAGVNVYKFRAGFALSQYQRGVMSYQFSLSTDIDSFLK